MQQVVSADAPVAGSLGLVLCRGQNGPPGVVTEMLEHLYRAFAAAYRPPMSSLQTSGYRS